MGSTTRYIYPSMSELIDRLTVVQLKEVLVPKGKESFGREIRRIENELDMIFSHAGKTLSSRFIRLVIALAQINLHIWKEKERMTHDESRFDQHLKLSHQLNGLRNQLKNELLEKVGTGEPSLVKTNIDTEDLKGWDLSVLQRKGINGFQPPSGLDEDHRYAYLLTDLIDALTIDQIKEALFQDERRDAIAREIEELAQEIDVCLRKKRLNPPGHFVGLLVLLAQSNLHVWMIKDLMQSSLARYNELLDMAQDLNGLRNHVRNIMMEDLGESEPCYQRTTFLSHDGARWYSPSLCRLKISSPEEEACVAITGDELSLNFGIAEKDLSDDCRARLRAGDFRYKTLEGLERDGVIKNIIARMESGDYWVSGDDKRQVWEKGWGENLAEYKKTKDVLNLKPKFLQAKKVLRLGRRYITPINPNFEFDLIDIFRRWVFQKYLSDVSSVYEFGCGSCQHLPVLAELFPHKDIHGLDWAEASRKIIETLVRDKGWKIKGHTFNLFSPDQDFPIATNSGVFTIGTMEQLGSNFVPFLQYLLSKGPSVVFHIESMAELYDENNLVDYLAKIYDGKRNYLVGYIDRLRELEKEGRIDILEMRRVYFGSMFHDSYSLVAWRPSPSLAAGS